MPSLSPLPSPHHYILLSLSPSTAASATTPTTTADPLAIRKSLQDALSQTFGHTASNTYMDVLAVGGGGSGGGGEVVIRVRAADRESILAAIAISPGALKFALSKESSFLPSLVSSGFCVAEASS